MENKMTAEQARLKTDNQESKDNFYRSIYDKIEKTASIGRDRIAVDNRNIPYTQEFHKHFLLLGYKVQENACNNTIISW